MLKVGDMHEKVFYIKLLLKVLVQQGRLKIWIMEIFLYSWVSSKVTLQNVTNYFATDR